MKFDPVNFGFCTITSENPMTKFRKKPVVISAHQWFKNGDHPSDHHPFVPGGDRHRYSEYVNDVEGKVVRRYRGPGIDGKSVCKHCGDIMHIHGWIDTLEGGHIVCPGDWIITGVKGENYPCKPDIFSATYDAIPDSEEAYQPCGAMTFGLAIEALKNGLRVARSGWNGKGMWLSLSCNPGGDAAAGRREIAAENFWSKNNYEFANQNGGSAVVLPCITMKTATGEILMGWLASQTDMLAEDWVIVE